MDLRWNLVLAAFVLLLVGVSACNKAGGGGAQSNDAEHAAVPHARAGDATAAATEPGSTALPSAKHAARRITGHVSSTPDGKPVADAIIRLGAIGHSNGKSPSLECRSDSAGAYVLDDAPMGNWMLTCSAQMHVTAQHNVSVPGAGGDVVHDFVLDSDPRVSMVVRLRARGGGAFTEGLRGDDVPLATLLHPEFVDTCPARGADLPPGTKVMSFKGAVKDASGTDEWYDVTLASAQSGCCCLMLGDHVLDAVAFASAATSVTLETSIDDVHRATGSLHFVVLDAVTKKPLVGAQATLRPASGPALVVDTFSEGIVDYPHVLPGDALLEIDAPGHAHGKQKLTIHAGKETDLGTLSLPASVGITGSIDMPKGPDAAHTSAVEVFAYRVEGDDASYVTTVHAEADGKIAFEKLDPGEYLISWQPRHPAPNAGPVKKGAIPGWIYVDARYGDVRDVHIAVTAAMWGAESTRKTGAH